MVSYPSINLVDSIIDEVALEGLDGITIEALWLRLAHRLHNPLPFSKSFMVQLWSMCVQIREFAFYKLETAREPLIIFDRYQFVDPDLGIILEPETVPADIYPHCPVNDVSNGVKGSCSTYYTREDVTEIVRSLNLDEATKKYGQKLVIVASQSARNHALMGDEVSPILELNVTQYCFLERVGRSRYHGEVTQGKLSLSALKEDPKSLFYHRKFLLRYKLITKQIHHQKSGSNSSNGSLLHLPRFFVERKPKIIFLAEEVIKILKSKPNCVAEYDEIKRKLQIENAIKKLFKTSFFQKVVKTDIRVPYRTLYPNAPPIEWQQKNNSTKEKKIKVVQLLLPNIDILEAWNKDEIQDEDESHELNISNHKYGVPYLKQANAIIEANEIDGVCQGSLAKIMGLTKLQSRTILRNIVKTNIVATYMNDIGRQRLTKYVSKKYEKASKLSKQFKKEIHKIKELTKQIAIGSDGLETKTIKENIVINDEKESVRKILKSDIMNKINKVQVKEENSYSNNMLQQISELSKNEKVVAAYKNIKVDITVLKLTNEKKSENEVYGFMEDVQNSEKKNVTNITYRLLRRANMIIESVKEHQVIDDMTKLMKMIHEEEDKEGYDVKIDKKSLLRLLQKLAKDNLVKHIKITLNGNGKEKHLKFICDPNIDVNSAVIQSAVEQAKLKFFLMTSQKLKSSTKHTENATKFECNKDINDTINKSEKNQSAVISISSKCGPRISRKYGYSPKFLRMQALHIFLFYLVYEHPGHQTLSKAEQIKILRDNDFNITEELAEEFNTIYTKDVSWKMFVPPLPQYNGWPRGWTLMCDILLRLPLSIFLKIHYISFVIPDMEKYINHPIRKHYLVRDLPVDIRNSLLYLRKYIFHIHETVTRLCYIGLIQFGPQKLKEKDQVFIYVNRRSELMDTTSSAPGYHIIEDKSYPIIKYNFDEIQIVEKYWYDMWNTCMNTPLGGRLVVQGKDIVLEDLNKKIDMINAVIARSPEEAARLDTGKVPGDRKGAAGIDSACFAHLKRNWSWGFSNSGIRQTNKQQNVVYERESYLSKIKAKPIRFTERVLPRKCNNKKRTKYDEVDYRALQRMHKLRVNWESYEDKILLVCKVAMVYLCPNPRKQVITFSAVRDVLRTYSYSSHNKTSRACQRRLLYMLRQQRNVDTVALGVEELKQNFFLKKRFGGIVDKLKEEHKSSSEYEKQVTEAFKSLVTYIAKKYYDISDVGSKEPLPVPKTVQEFNLFYKIVHPTKPFYNRGFTKDIRNVNDIHFAVINSVINSSMCCGKDRRSWAYQLFKIYQQYPEMLLRNAMAKSRSDQMVTIKKNQLTTIRKYGNYMPMSSSQYQLSSNYIYKFHTKWPYSIFKESYDIFYKLSNWYCHNQMNDQSKASDNFNGIEMFPTTGGLIGAIHDYIVQDQIDFDIEIPDQVIMLDPRLNEKDETYFRIAKRYQDVLANLDNLKFIKEFSLQNNSAIDLEEHNGKSFDSKVDTVHYNNICNAGGKLDKEGFSDLDTEKNTLLQEFEESESYKYEDKILNVESPSSSHLNPQLNTDERDKLITSERKKRKSDGNEVFDLNELQIQKKKRLDHDIVDAEKSEEVLQKNDVILIEMSNKIQNENSKEHFNNETTEINNLKYNNEKDISNKEFEISLQSKKRSEHGFTRVSDILKNIPTEQNYLNSYCKIDDVHKRYNRIALLRMREELSELTVADSHHAHEYFVVNMFKVFYSLYRSNSQNVREVFRDLPMPSDLLPLKLNTINDLIQEVNKFTVFPKNNISFSDLKKILPNDFSLNLNSMDIVYEFVYDKKEFGATIQDLIDEFEDLLKENLYQIVSFFTNNHLFLRSGVTVVRYIHHRYVDSWLINSYKICRLEKESLIPVPKGTVYVIESKEASNKDNDVNILKELNQSPTRLLEKESSKIASGNITGEDIQLEIKDSNENKSEDSTKDTSSHSDEEYNTEMKKRMPRKRIKLHHQKDISKPLKQLNSNSKQEIKVVIKPWIRIDGVLNRRVFDRMLGTILSYCLTHPGIALSKIQNRFVPALQPCHTRELIEILVKLECLEKIILKKSRVTLFSKPSEVKPKIANNDWATEEDIFIEPKNGAMLKFGIFLSTKMYNTDFIA
ncbi:General transcription factor 3C polypeptide 1 [Melipona quadrifasciata]|uniref:General transcription factor 3C polypeptide 1 n=1 Tax=Melipona quadrifasciata TaxID=166423 RepID=A0A0M9A1E2_9HYME|nr:General transcription factor 3C polypeptide 1 [Melipona quadrifasciata]